MMMNNVTRHWVRYDHKTDTFIKTAYDASEDSNRRIERDYEVQKALGRHVTLDRDTDDGRYVLTSRFLGEGLYEVGYTERNMVDIMERSYPELLRDLLGKMRKKLEVYHRIDTSGLNLPAYHYEPPAWAYEDTRTSPALRRLAEVNWDVLRGESLVHGDAHWKNWVLWPAVEVDEHSLHLVDWETACRGVPEVDLASLCYSTAVYFSTEAVEGGFFDAEDSTFREALRVRVADAYIYYVGRLRRAEAGESGIDVEVVLQRMEATEEFARRWNLG